MTSSVETPVPVVRTTKIEGLLWFAGAAAATMLVSRALRWLTREFPLTMEAPLAVPENWWRVDLRVTEAAGRELVLLALFAIFLRLRGQRLSDLGFRRPGTKAAWFIALVVLAFGLLSHPFVRNGGPYPFAIYTLYAGFVLAIPVALLEESIYRGFSITTLNAAGFSVPAQVLLSGIVFGLVHFSYVGSDWTVPVFTGVLGCIWAWIFIIGRCSLWPTLISHVINDAVIMPYFYVHGVY